ncbi:MAG TPA: sugar ABC transporter permease [Ruminiclostridium sp.]
MIKTFFKRYGTSYAFLLPWIFGILIFTLIPILVSLYYSFTDFGLFKKPEWIGMTNYIEMFTRDARYIKSIKVTAIYVAVGVPLKLAFALLLAMILNKGMRGLVFFRAVYYVPSLLGGSVAVAILWRQVFGQSGVVNHLLGLIGIRSTTSWIAHPDYTLGVLIALMVWQFGSSMIIFLAGLKQVPIALYEAADIDGAKGVSKFFRITLPMISPVILFNLVMQTIQSFQVFTPAYIIGGPEGKPLDSILFYTLYLYTQGFSRLQMGYASAMAWMLLIVTALITGLIFLTAKNWVFYED